MHKTRRISKYSSKFPERLKNIPGCPEELHVIGDLPDEGISVAIVGARKCSVYGRSCAYEMGKLLASNGVQVISGMALGVDCYAQEGAVDAGGRSFAVLGCGADICYPATNTTLYNRLSVQGGIISEFPDGTRPFAPNFPKRNRIISGLADYLIVVEAREKSGSLITVDYALEQGRSVYAFPGRYGDELSKGCNRLIAQGAGIIYSPEAFLEEIGIKKVMIHNDAALSKCAQKVLKAIGTDPTEMWEIAEKIKLDAADIRKGIIELLMCDRIKELPGHIYFRL